MFTCYLFYVRHSFFYLTLFLFIFLFLLLLSLLLNTFYGTNIVIIIVVIIMIIRDENKEEVRCSGATRFMCWCLISHADRIWCKS